MPGIFWVPWSGEPEDQENLKLRASLRNNRDGALVVSSRRARNNNYTYPASVTVAQRLPNPLDGVQFLGWVLPLDGMLLDISIVVSNFHGDRRCPPALPIRAKRTGASTPGSQNDGAPCTVAAKPSAIPNAYQQRVRMELARQAPGDSRTGRGSPLLGVWLDREAPALQAAICGFESHHFHEPETRVRIPARLS